MSPRRNFAILFALLATATAVVFLAISVDRDVYAPGASAIHRELRKHDVAVGERSAPSYVAREFNVRRVLRKLYSVVAFSIVGFFAAPLVPRDRRIAIDALLIAAFSGIIEVAQRFSGSEESALSNAFDVACGALGGLVGAAVWNALTRRLRLPIE